MAREIQLGTMPRALIGDAAFVPLSPVIRATEVDKVAISLMVRGTSAHPMLGAVLRHTDDRRSA